MGRGGGKNGGWAAAVNTVGDTRGDEGSGHRAGSKRRNHSRRPSSRVAGDGGQNVLPFPHVLCVVVTVVVSRGVVWCLSVLVSVALLGLSRADERAAGGGNVLPTCCELSSSSSSRAISVSRALPCDRHATVLVLDLGLQVPEAAVLIRALALCRVCVERVEGSVCVCVRVCVWVGEEDGYEARADR